MVRKTNIVIVICILLLNAGLLRAQDEQARIRNIQNKLESLVVDIPQLDEKVDISVNGVSIQEFVRGIANNVNLNITVDPALRINIINNFTQVRVMDILVFLCKEYQLEIHTLGTILTIKKYNPPVVEAPPPAKHLPVINYVDSLDLLSMDLFNDTISDVVKEIIDVTGKNVVLSPDVRTQVVSAYIQKMPFDNVLEKFAYANNLTVSKTEDGFYLIEKVQEQDKGANTGSAYNRQHTRPGRINQHQKKVQGAGEFEYEVISKDSISVSAIGAPLYDIVKLVSDELMVDYFMVSSIEGESSLFVKNITYDELLFCLLHGTEYTFVRQNGNYLIGDSKNPALITTRRHEMQFRTVDKITEIIPADISEKVDIIEVPEMNSLILTGTSLDIDEVEMFLKDIDRIVPVVLIEIILVDIRKNYTFSTGIKAGLSDSEGENLPESNMQVFPAVDMNLSTDAINDVIDGINGFGWINLGKVNSNFYMNIKAMEDNGVLKIRSVNLQPKVNF
jgi:type IV pilus assembly protein PilQ